MAARVTRRLFPTRYVAISPEWIFLRRHSREQRITLQASSIVRPFSSSCASSAKAVSRSSSRARSIEVPCPASPEMSDPQLPEIVSPSLGRKPQLMWACR